MVFHLLYNFIYNLKGFKLLSNVFFSIVFFAAFFGALYYIRHFSLPWLGGEGSHDSMTNELLWNGFENQLNYKSVTSISIILASKTPVYMDEMSFHFLEQEKSLVLIKEGIDKNRLKDIAKKNEEKQVETGVQMQSKKKRDFELR